ncbi:N-6 DNA methylase [Ligilactobacillus pobuzihii]|uniref:site-specific DNA-methyltransferase (adenine-specific) n=1 Tax=Ligilactobacillus pobuzihii TaxID=449659 RepID=A0A0R2LA25_9LACO|nr:N-6 DNA methylase [Ligilactobacillus pobuzihii]KRK09449.1 RNA methylase [Ligilactobacillus pobuzihii E100301 = KCTC 13174]KRN95575.1 RNA methylase [Ligilactobacillus pobuzihii]GEN48007.1 hypothetical protein LPO01_07990 [Ligilactobacillus pobuzihii]
MKRTVSKATLANWQRLGSNEKKLLHRANKTESLRKIFPDKYIKNSENKQVILSLADFITVNKLDLQQFICQLALSAVKQASTISDDNKARFQQAVTKQLTHVREIPGIKRFHVDFEEPDFLGALYQTLQAEGARNKNGLYYTPFFAADELLQQVFVDNNADFLDPAVGTGIFLVELVREFNIPVAALHGTDTDPIAVLLATANLLLQAPLTDNSYPDIVVRDFLRDPTPTLQKYSYIVGNPPWGAKKLTAVPDSQFQRADSFAYFIEKSVQELSDGGTLAFVLPVSLLNIGTHEPVRQLILANSVIKSITYLPHLFQGVVSDVVLLVLTKGKTTNNKVIFRKSGQQITVPQVTLNKMPQHNFLPLQKSDCQILHDIWQKPHADLRNSTWGLGIVTGNNQKYVLKQAATGAEPLLTGKDVQPYLLRSPQRFLKFQRENFQQTATEEVYRSPEKLVYKFINDQLIFAYDDQQRLTLNSANILVPKVDTHSVKTVLAFLNSALFQYLNQVLFASPKVLRGNLEELPFAKLSVSERTRLEKLVTEQLSGKDLRNEINKFVFDKYELNQVEIKRVQEVLANDVFE